MLALKHGELPPSLHFEQAESADRFREQPVLRQLRARGLAGQRPSAPRRRELFRHRRHQRARRAGGSAPGGSADRVHEAETAARRCRQRPKPRSSRPSTVLPATSRSIRRSSSRTLPTPFRSAARRFNHRRVLVCENAGVAEAAAALRARDPLRMLAGSRRAEERPVAFMFPGQGTQYVNMGLELYRTGADVPRTHRSMLRAPAASPWTGSAPAALSRAAAGRGHRAAEADRGDPAGAVRDRVRPGDAPDGMGGHAGRHDRPQHRRVRGRVPCRSAVARGCAGRRRRAGPVDGADAAGRHAGRFALRGARCSRCSRADCRWRRSTAQPCASCRARSARFEVLEARAGQAGGSTHVACTPRTHSIPR